MRQSLAPTRSARVVNKKILFREEELPANHGTLTRVLVIKCKNEYIVQPQIPKTISEKVSRTTSRSTSAHPSAFELYPTVSLGRPYRYPTIFSLNFRYGAVPPGKERFLRSYRILRNAILRWLAVAASDRHGRWAIIVFYLLILYFDDISNRIRSAISCRTTTSLCRFDVPKVIRVGEITGSSTLAKRGRNQRRGGRGQRRPAGAWVPPHKSPQALNSMGRILRHHLQTCFKFIPCPRCLPIFPILQQLLIPTTCTLPLPVRGMVDGFTPTMKSAFSTTILMSIPIPASMRTHAVLIDSRHSA